MKKVMVERFRVTTAELADRLLVTPARIGQLCEIGVLEKGDDKHFDLTASVGQFALYTQNPRLFDRR
jgi:hypothetical protein